MRLFVTGASGFIGRHFVRAAPGQGHEVVGLWYPGEPPTAEVPPGLTWVAGSLEDHFEEALGGCQALVHLAAFGVPPQRGCEDWTACFRWNLMASLQFWTTALSVGVNRILICGTCAEYGQSAARHLVIPPEASLEPVGAYASSKAAASLAALALGRSGRCSVAVLRLANVFGDGQHPENFWPALRRAALAGRDFPMTAGEQVRDFVPVEQVAQRFLEVLAQGVSEPGQPRVENLGTGRPQLLRDFAAQWWERWGAQGRLLVGALPYREGELMRLVAEVNHRGG